MPAPLSGNRKVTRMVWNRCLRLTIFAHFLLAVTILPGLAKAALRPGGDVRAVCTTSAGFRMHPDNDSLHINDEELDVENPKRWWKGTMPMYGRSKTCNILFVADLNSRVRQRTAWEKAMKSNAVHPSTVSTNLNTGLEDSWTKILERVVYGLVAVSVLYPARAIQKHGGNT